VFGEDFFQTIDEELLGTDNQNLVPALFFEIAHRHAVFLEETDEGIAGDTAILAAGDAVAPEAAGIEPLGHRARRDLADFRDLAGGEPLPHCRHCRHSIFRVAESTPRPATAGGPAGEFPTRPGGPLADILSLPGDAEAAARAVGMHRRVAVG